MATTWSVRVATGLNPGGGSVTCGPGLEVGHFKLFSAEFTSALLSAAFSISVPIITPDVLMTAISFFASVL
jgi:hypothetical protein